MLIQTNKFLIQTWLSVVPLCNVKARQHTWYHLDGTRRPWHRARQHRAGCPDARALGSAARDNHLRGESYSFRQRQCKHVAYHEHVHVCVLISKGAFMRPWLATLTMSSSHLSCSSCHVQIRFWSAMDIDIMYS